MFIVFKVKGDSMSPLIHNGDFIFGLKYTFTKPKKNHLIVFNHSTYGLCVKKVIEVSNKKILVEGVNKESSLSTEQIGPLKAADLICRVLHTFSKN